MKSILSILSLFAIVAVQAQHPMLYSKGSTLKELRQATQQTNTLFGKTFADMVKKIDPILDAPIEVPVPRDDAGGFTHIVHQENYQRMYEAGQLFNLTQDKRYADYIKRSLLAYSKLIPLLPNHPKAKSSSPGRLFHQALNDCNWIVYSIQAYDAIYDVCNIEEQLLINKNVYGVLCNFLTKDLENWFNLIHNHGVWACTAVGMVGLVTQDQEKIEMSLKGTKKDGRSGFLAQMQQLYSPDGYYTEGPYYARYAMLPFYIFSWALDHAQPQSNIFQYRDRILLKAFTTTIQLTNTDGRFFPLNDAIKDKSYRTAEMVVGSNIALFKFPEAQSYIGIAAAQSKVMLNEAGLAVSKQLLELGRKIPSIPYRSMDIVDGPDGKQGGVAILRNQSRDQQSTAILKYTSHGLSHGHYDKLNLILYQNGNEIFQDYGAARFINIEQKYGGRYLPENGSFAVQSIAHNTVVAHQKSHFDARESVSEKFHGDKVFTSFGSDGNIASATSTEAYAGQLHQRTILQFELPSISTIWLLDLFSVENRDSALYDLPFWYQGQFIHTNLSYSVYPQLEPLGFSNGYQHIWKEAFAGISSKKSIAYTFLNNKNYYTMHMASSRGDSIYWGRLGANDPNFNLRNESMIMLRRKAANTMFVTVLEPHGYFSASEERSIGSSPSVDSIELLYHDQSNVLVQMIIAKRTWIICVNTKDKNPSSSHQVMANGIQYTWKGHFSIQ